MHLNMKKFLTTIAFSEGTLQVKGSEDGYNVIVGGGLFESYADHPRKLINLPKLKIKSTAAGRYQIMEKIFDAYKERLHLKDFSPTAQDAIAIQLIKECKAVEDIEKGCIENALVKCKSRWSSLPGSGYGQHEHTMNHLIKYYKSLEG